MIKCLKYQERIILMAVTFTPDYLQAAIAFFDKSLSEESVVVNNGTDNFTIKIPEKVRNLEGRSKHYQIKLKIL